MVRCTYLVCHIEAVSRIAIQCDDVMVLRIVLSLCFCISMTLHLMAGFKSLCVTQATLTCTRWGCVNTRARSGARTTRLRLRSEFALHGAEIGLAVATCNLRSRPYYKSVDVKIERDAHDDTRPRPRADLRLHLRFISDSGGRKIWYSGGLVSHVEMFFRTAFGPCHVEAPCWIG